MTNQQLSTNTFGPAKWIVSPTASDGTHTTIGAALTAASSGDTIFIRPGTYTENLTLVAGVNLTAYSCDATQNVTVVGKCTLTAAGVVSISNIIIQTNSDFAIAITGSAASSIVLTNCTVSCTNNSGISLTSSGGGGLTMYECDLTLGTTGINFFTITSSAFLLAYYSIFNGGTSTTASTTSNGAVNLFYCRFDSPITTTSTGKLLLQSSSMSTSGTTCLTIGGSGTNQVQDCYLLSGSASAVSISSTFFMIGNNTVSSSNTNAITGSGTLNYNPIFFSGSSATVNATVTQSPNSGFGPTIYTQGVSFNSGTNTLSNYTVGTYTSTMVGASTAGTTTYTAQQGYYVRVGGVVTVQAVTAGSAATGTGVATFGSLPFTVKNQTNGIPVGSVLSQSNATWVFPTGTTSLAFSGNANATTAQISASGTATTGGNMAIANAAFVFYYTLTYEI